MQARLQLVNTVRLRPISRGIVNQVIMRVRNNGMAIEQLQLFVAHVNFKQLPFF
jgi:hypothetical protein